MISAEIVRQVRRGFSLLELAIVIVIFWILATVAAPRMFETATRAQESNTRQSLVVVRNAIELYQAKTGSLPGKDGSEATFKANLRAYLQGPFPRAEYGQTGDRVRVVGDDNPLTAAGSEAWAYNCQTGQFVINHESAINW